MRRHTQKLSTWAVVQPCIVLALLAGASRSHATPTLALKEANNCAACHKSGRSQKPFLWRRCTLDCQGCHTDPSGGGPRNEWGVYYSQAAAGVNLATFREPIDPLQNQAFLSLHYDGRVINRQAEDGVNRTFPMSSEFSARLKPMRRWLHVSWQALMLGQPDDQLLRVVKEGDRPYREKFSLMVDELPLNTWVRAQRGPPLYGLRRTNHTLWIRERNGFNPHTTTESVEFGFSPNVPYFRGSYMRGDPYASKEDRQVGTSWHGGMRGVTLGWHVNASGWRTASDRATVDMNAFGAGLNVLGMIFYGEKNRRNVAMSDDLQAEVDAGATTGAPLRVHPSSTTTEYKAAVAAVPGLIFGMVYETLEDDYTSGERRSIFFDLHPIPWVQLEVWRRNETGSRDLADMLAIGHIYWDF